MEEFHYYNLFATKGTEYLLTIIFFLLLIPFWIMLNKNAKSATVTNSIANIFRTVSDIPQHFYMAINHIWVKPVRANQIRLGINHLIGNLVITEQVVLKKNPGESVAKGEPIAELHCNGKLLQLVSPLSGVVRKTNALLEKSSGINKLSPYHEAWMIELEAENWQQEVQFLIKPKSVKSWMINELSRARDFLAQIQSAHNPVAQPIILQDGGEIDPQVFAEMPHTIWNDFEQAFLRLPEVN
jgi:glycine cleavage system H lipoate-binding protein